MNLWNTALSGLTVIAVSVLSNFTPFCPQAQNSGRGALPRRAVAQAQAPGTVPTPTLGSARKRAVSRPRSHRSPRASGRPINAVITESLDSQNRLAAIVGDGRFADILVLPETRIYGGQGVTSAEDIPSGAKLNVWGKWDKTRPEACRAYVIEVVGQLTEIQLLRRVEGACRNVSRRRTVPFAAPERTGIIEDQTTPIRPLAPPPSAPLSPEPMPLPTPSNQEIGPIRSVSA